MESWEACDLWRPGGGGAETGKAVPATPGSTRPRNVEFRMKMPSNSHAVISRPLKSQSCNRHANEPLSFSLPAESSFSVCLLSLIQQQLWFYPASISNGSSSRSESNTFPRHTPPPPPPPPPTPLRVFLLSTSELLFQKSISSKIGLSLSVMKRLVYPPQDKSNLWLAAFQTFGPSLLSAHRSVLCFQSFWRKVKTCLHVVE